MIEASPQYLCTADGLYVTQYNWICLAHHYTLLLNIVAQVNEAIESVPPAFAESPN